MAVVGDIAKTENIEVISRGVAASTKITKGDMIGFDANGRCVVALTTSWADAGFGVAIETQDNSSGAADALFCRVAIPNTWVYITAGGAISPNHLVKFGSGATGATVAINHAFPADVTATVSNVDVNNAKSCYALAFGRYIAHENEEQNATAAANTDVIIVRLGP